MSGTKIIQERSSLVVEGVTYFEIHTVVSDRGDVQDNGFFLVEISDPDDPTTDVFQRVVGIGDFDLYGLSRDDAIDDASLLYRSPEFFRRYTALDVAVNAAKITKDRVDTLVADWEVYSTSFETVSEETDFPLTDIQLVTSLVNTYVADNEALTVAQLARGVAETALTTALADAASSQAVLDTLTTTLTVVNNLQVNVTSLTAATNALNTLSVALGTLPMSGFGVSPGQGSGYYRSINDMLVDYTSSLTTLDGLVSGGSITDPTAIAAIDLLDATKITFLASTVSFSGTATTATGIPLSTGLTAVNNPTDITSISSALAVAQATNATAQTALRSAQLNVITATATADQAQETADASLAAIVAACPDFDPADPTAVIQ